MKTPLLRPLAAASLCLLLIGPTACHKTCPTPASPTPESASSTQLVGRWELTHTSGGIAGRTQPADPTQKQEIIFGSDGQSSALLNGTVVSQSAYSLTQAPALTGRTETFVLYTSRSTSRAFIQKLSATELALTQDAYDGFTLHYTRR